MFLNLNIDEKLLDYWKENNLSESDFYCKDCGKPLFDFSILEKIEFLKWKNKEKLPFLRYKDTKKHYIESEQERWCVVGRFLSGKHYQRKICWDCFFKSLKCLIIKKQDKIKNTWMQKLRRNELNKIPPSWQSPAFYFSLLFDIKEEDLKKEMNKFITSSPEFFKRKFGEEKWKEEFEKYRQLQAKVGNTLEYFIEKYGKTEGKKKYEKLCKEKAISLKNCIKRYGQKQGREQFERYCEIQKYVGCKLEYFVNLYGKENGIKKYLEICKNRSKFAGYSKISQKLFQELDEKLGILASDSKYATKNKEAEIEIILKNGTPKIVRPDYLLGKKIIEFNGDFWHANPKMFSKDDFIMKNIKVKNIWDHDRSRQNALKKNGFDIYVVWEHDYLHNKEKTLKKCLDFLKS